MLGSQTPKISVQLLLTLLLVQPIGCSKQEVLQEVLQDFQPTLQQETESEEGNREAEALHPQSATNDETATEEMETLSTTEHQEEKLTWKIGYSSRRALDGSDEANSSGTYNLWVIESDGSKDTPLTHITAANAHTSYVRWSPDGNKILFDSKMALDGSDSANTNSTGNIWVVNPDGTGLAALTQMTATGAQCFNARWSVNNQILFESRRALDGSDALSTNDVYNIWVMNADGSNPTPLTTLTAAGADNRGAFWSQDGTKIVYESSRALDGSDAANTNNAGNIWVMNADGSENRPLTQLTVTASVRVHILWPQWSHDGTKVLYQSKRALDGSDAVNTNETFNIWVTNADGNVDVPLTMLTAANAGSFHPGWSPDGEKIVYHSKRALDGSNAANTNAVMNVWMMNADGSEAIPLTNVTAENAHSIFAHWSPDGKKISYTSAQALDGSNTANTNADPAHIWVNLWVINADGSGATPLTHLTAANSNVYLPMPSP